METLIITSNGQLAIYNKEEGTIIPINGITEFLCYPIFTPAILVKMDFSLN